MNHVNIRLLLAKVPYTDGLAPLVVQSLVWNGQFGVQIFFAISGFLITSISLRRWQSLSEIRVRDFYLLRFARIAPRCWSCYWRYSAACMSQKFIISWSLRRPAASAVRSSQRSRFNWVGIASLVLILGFASEPFLRRLDRAGLEETILAIGTCLVIIACAQTEWKSPRFLLPLLRLGQYSYEVYLTHMFVVFTLFSLKTIACR